MKKRLVVLLVAVALAGCGLLDGGTAQRLAKAEKALQSGNYSEAAITLRNVVDKEPGNAQAQLLLARAHYMRGDAAAADASLDAAGKAGAAPAAVADMRAKLALGRGQFNELLHDLDAGKYKLTEQAAQIYRARAEQGLGHPVEALAIFDTLLAAKQDSADVHLYAAECHATLGRPQRALQHVEAALALQPDSARAWRLRAALQSADAQAALHKAIDAGPGQLTIPEQLALIAPEFQRAANRLDAEAAGELQQKLLQLAPEAPLTQWASGELQLIRGDAADATATLQHVVQRAAEFTPARPALIGALLTTGNLEQAIQESKVLVGSAPDDQRPKTAQQAIKQAADAATGSEQQMLQSAAAAMLLEQTPAARRLLEQGLEAHPDSEALAVLAIQQQQAAGEISEALQRARALAARMPKSSSVQSLLAVVQSANGDYAAAQKTYDALWRQSPSAAIALNLAQMRLRTREGDPLGPLRQWMASHPDDLQVRIGLASAAMELGQYDVATAEYERIIAVATTNAVALNNLAWLYSRRGDGRALATARRAYAAAATPEIADTYGWLLLQAGDAKAALPLLEKAARGAPGKPEIRYHYAAALARGGSSQGREAARLWLIDLLADPTGADWRGAAEQLLAQLPAP